MNKYLFAPSEYWELTKSQREKITNGCGSKRFGSIVVPDTFYGLRVSEACNIHDFMYTIGETIEDKYIADRVFLNNLIRIIDKHTNWKILNRLRCRRAYKYYFFAKVFGGPSFWENKNKPLNMGC